MKIELTPPKTFTPETIPDPQKFIQSPTQAITGKKKYKKYLIVGLSLFFILSFGSVTFLTYRDFKPQTPTIFSPPPTIIGQPPTAAMNKAVLKDPAGLAAITIPKSSFFGNAVFEILPIPSAMCDCRESLRPVGSSVSFDIREWSPPTQEDLKSFAFKELFEIEMYYTDESVEHLDENKFTIYHCNPDDKTSKALATQVDIEKNTATAKAKELGDFSLYGPLICPEDLAEFDDSFYVATLLGIGGPIRKPQSRLPFGTKVKRLFDIKDDEDWFKFLAEKGKSYTLETSDLAQGVDTLITLFNPDGVSKITSNDNVDEKSLASQIERTPSGKYLEYSPELMLFYIQVKPTNQSSFGCHASYNFSVIEK